MAKCLELLSPIGLRPGLIQFLQPVDELPIGWSRRQFSCLSPAQFFVDGEYFLKHQADRPPIDDQVMKRPEESKIFFTQLCEGHSHQGWGLQIEPCLSLTPNEFIGSWNGAGPREEKVGRRIHLLSAFAGRVPIKARPQGI